MDRLTSSDLEQQFTAEKHGNLARATFFGLYSPSPSQALRIPREQNPVHGPQALVKFSRNTNRLQAPISLPCVIKHTEM